MQYLLDTCVMSDLYQGDKNTLKKIKSLAPNDMAISALTAAEMFSCQVGNQTQKEKAIARYNDRLFKLLKILEINFEVAKVAGIMKSNLKKDRRVMTQHSLLMAATAKTHELVLVTNDAEVYSCIEGVVLENWREGRK